MRWTFARFGIQRPDPGLVAGAVDAFFAYEGRCWTADPEALSVLQDLDRGGMLLGMFSNATGDRFIQELVDRFGYRPLLSPALTSAGTGIRKPDPLAFTPILADWRLAPGQVVVVGDTLDADILGARRAGMRGVWIRSRHDARQEGATARALDGLVPDAEIRRLGELPGALNAMH
jgi:putative hydrolase of the HAD superfamily